MIVLLDTNVILDVLAKRQEFYTFSRQVLRYCEARKLSGYISATSITDIMYVLRKHVAPDTVRDTVKTLLAVVNVAGITKSDILSAFACDMKDFEDAVQASCAKRIKAEYIVTRNAKDFLHSPVRAITPGQLLQELKAE